MVYAEIKTSDKTKIRISRDEVNGNTFGQIRVWTTDAKSGELVPTKKSVAFKLDNTQSILDGLLKLESDYREEIGDGASA